jgi:hypothetical protein
MPPLRTSRDGRRGLDDAGRRSVVPTAAARSLWRAAVWTGMGAAIVCAVLAIVVVAICWLPVSGSTGRTHSAIHAGLLTFLAAVHGGVTVDGTAGFFLPLGMLLAVGLTAWRAGAGLADAAAAIGETDPARLALAGLTQAASFAIACLVAVPLATLGTSSAPFLTVGAAALLLFAVAGGAALVCYSPLSDWCLDRIPVEVRHGARAAVVVLAVYAAAGALLVAAALAVHHGRVEELSRQVGGGWGGVPILLLGVLAAPNAVIAGIGYLAGPGFAVGTQTTVSPFSTAHGTLPAFPILGGLPAGHGADPAAWLLVAVTPAVAGLLLARFVRRTDGWTARLRVAGSAVGFVAVALAVLAWQGGGSIGAGALSAVGASPWQLGLAVAAAVSAVAAVVLAVVALRERLARSGRDTTAAAVQRLVALTKPAAASGDGKRAGKSGNADSEDQLAG